MEPQNISSSQPNLSAAKSLPDPTLLQRAGQGVRQLGIENLGLYVVFAAIFIFLSVVSPYFLTLQNLFDIARQSTFVLVVSLGMTFVILTAGIDLSVGSILGLAAGVTSVILLQGFSTPVAVLGGLATGALCGLINGLVITRLGVTDFIATLAALSVFRGVLFTMTQGVPFAAFARPSFSFLGRGEVGPVPTPIIIVLLIFLGLWYLLNQIPFGRHVLSTGSNRSAAYLSGVRVSSIKLWVYIISGLCSATAGIMLAARLSSVPPDLGQGYELSAIAAVVIGGTSLFGGRGTLLGTVMGALMIAMISNGLILLNVNPFYQFVINGVLIVIAVSLNRVRQR